MIKLLRLPIASPWLSGITALAQAHFLRLAWLAYVTCVLPGSANAEPFKFSWSRLPVAVDSRAAIVSYKSEVELFDSGRVVLRVTIKLDELKPLIIDSIAFKAIKLQRECGDSFVVKKISLHGTEIGVELQSTFSFQQWSCFRVSTLSCKGLSCRPVEERKRVLIGQGEGQISSIAVPYNKSEDKSDLPIIHNLDFVVLRSPQDDRILRTRLEPLLKQDELLQLTMRSVIDGLALSIGLRSTLPSGHAETAIRRLKGVTTTPGDDVFGLRLEADLQVDGAALAKIREYLAGR